MDTRDLKHWNLMREIIARVIDDTFFGLAAVAFAVTALWVFPQDSFFRGCSICLALIFGGWFYVATIVRVSRKKMCRRFTKGWWLFFVIALPVAGGLLYYYLRLAAGYLPFLERKRLWEENEPFQFHAVKA